MINSKVKFRKVTFDVKSFRSELDIHIFKLLEGAISEFVKNVYPHVPVQTGMARASLQPLAEIVNVQVPISPKITTPWATRRLSLGRLLGKQGSNISDFIIVKRNQWGPFSYNFTWETEVPHWQFLESSPHSKVKSAPWEAISKGEEAMIRYLNNNAERILPELTDFIVEGK